VREWNIRTEVQVLGSICNSDHEDRRYKYLGLVKPEHFGGIRLEIFNRLITMMREGQAIPSFESLAEDQRLSQSARQIIGQARNVRYRNEADFTQGVKTLTAHYKARRLLALHKHIGEGLETENAAEHFDNIENAIEETLFQLRTDGAGEKITVGKAGLSDMKNTVKRVLTYTTQKRRFCTGWGEFDNNTGGLEPGNVLLMTANTGGGKTAAALTMLANMYRGHNLNIKYISLEMSEDKLTERFISTVTGIEYERVRKRTLSIDERKRVYNEYKRFEDLSTGSLSIYAPENDYTIEQLLSQVQSARTDVIILDYLGLVKPGAAGKGATEEYQLRQMTRYIKRAAERMKCAIIVLHQLNDEGQIMYSRGIGHHVHYWLKWFCRDEDLERGIVLVENGKARNAKRQDYFLKIDFAHMRMDNIEKPADYVPPVQEDTKRGGKPAKKEAPKTNIEIKLFDTVEN